MHFPLDGWGTLSSSKGFPKYGISGEYDYPLAAPFITPSVHHWRIFPIRAADEDHLAKGHAFLQEAALAWGGTWATKLCDPENGGCARTMYISEWILVIH